MSSECSAINPRNTAHSHCSPRKRRVQFISRKLLRAAHVMGPTLVALSLTTVANIAHAQGTMDFSGAQTLMTTFKTFAMYAGAVICLGGLIFAGIRMMSGRFQDAIPGLFGALFGAGVLGWGAGWIGLAAFGRSPLRGGAGLSASLRHARLRCDRTCREVRQECRAHLRSAESLATYPKSPRRSPKSASPPGMPT